MDKTELRDRYFDWMYRLVCDEKYTRGKTYFKLFHSLFATEFSYTLLMDGNRSEDGINLRYRFGYEKGYDMSMIACYLDIHPCSVLEMMVALAFRCEESIMHDPELGDRTGQWFWEMLNSLGLAYMDDAQFNQDRFMAIIIRFLNRKYECNGKGGLFTVKRRKEDMRNTEIWIQMNWYLNDLISVETKGDNVYGVCV